MRRCGRAMANDTALLTMHIAGVALIDGQERSYTLQIEQTAQQTFALEARRLSAQTLSDGSAPALRLSGPDSMPINSVFRAVAEFLTDQQADDDLDYMLFGISVMPTIDPTTLAMTIRLRRDAGDPSSLHIDFVPAIRRSLEFQWTRDWAIHRWLQDLKRMATRCPLTEPIFADQRPRSAEPLV
jgi:hypothetical protein